MAPFISSISRVLVVLVLVSISISISIGNNYFPKDESPPPNRHLANENLIFYHQKAKIWWRHYYARSKTYA